MTDPFATYANSLRQPDPKPFAALDELCQSLLGHKLFSCTLFELDDQGGGRAERVYTSDEASYPTSGLKEIVQNRWTGIVLDNHDTFVANSVEGFADVFPDHAFIASLGLGSVINLPVILQGSFLGTVNLLDVEGHYTPNRLAVLKQLEPSAQLAFRLH